MITTTHEIPTRFILPILAEFRRQPDGSYNIRPILPDQSGDSWLRVKEAARLLDLPPKTVYPLLGEFLVYKRPLKCRFLVSVRSILKYNEVTRDPKFWESPTAQAHLQTWVAERMP